jgi:uncharacterized protein
MQYRSVKGFTGWAQFGVLLALLGAGFILSAIVTSIVATSLMGIPYEKVGTDLIPAISKPQNLQYGRLIQMAGSLLLMMVPAFVYLLVCHGKKVIWLGFNKYVSVPQVAIGFFVILLTGFFADTLHQFSKFLLEYVPVLNAKAMVAEKAYNDQVAGLSNLKSSADFLVAVFMMALLPAIFEEALFRGAMQNLFCRWWKKPLLAIVVTSVIFSLIHASWYLFLSRLALGFVLGWMFYRSKNIWINIIAHFLNNCLAIMALFFTGIKDGKVDMTKMNSNLPWWAGLAAGAGVVALFIVFEKISANNRTAISMQENILIAKAKPFHDFLNEGKPKSV